MSVMNIGAGMSAGLLLFATVTGVGLCQNARQGGEVKTSPVQEKARIILPPPDRTGRMTLEQALARRRSVREFTAQGLSEQELSQLLWAAQGITHPDGRRTAPSAGALYPLELYVATASGFYHYDPHEHRLNLHSEGDLRPALYRASSEQDCVREAPAVFVITAVYERTEREYGRERGPRYVHLEAGHAAQNMLLQAVPLGLGGVPVGAFHDDAVQKALSLPRDHQPVYLIPIGHPR
jgi:SagB-type dehydrogenase family enzyme